MQKRRLWKNVLGMLLVAAFSSGGAPIVFATSSSSNSPNYQVTDTQFGSGSTQQTCSTQYCSTTSIGDMTAGDSSSSKYAAKFGAVTGSNPLLEVIVSQGESDLGVLSTETTGTKTMTVQVRSYLSDGYVLQIIGDAPKYGEHTLHTDTVPTASHPGTEQFGINAAANTSPSVGANAVQVPSSSTSFGVVNADYLTPNRFKYVNGGVVAHSDTSSGQTTYTISMVVNIANATPSGHYSGDFAAVVTPAY